MLHDRRWRARRAQLGCRSHSRPCRHFRRVCSLTRADYRSAQVARVQVQWLSGAAAKDWEQASCSLPRARGRTVDPRGGAPLTRQLGGLPSMRSRAAAAGGEARQSEHHPDRTAEARGCGARHPRRAATNPEEGGAHARHQRCAAGQPPLIAPAPPAAANLTSACTHALQRRPTHASRGSQ